MERDQDIVVKIIFEENESREYGFNEVSDIEYIQNAVNFHIAKNPDNFESTLTIHEKNIEAHIFDDIMRLKACTKNKKGLSMNEFAKILRTRVELNGSLSKGFKFDFIQPNNGSTGFGGQNKPSRFYGFGQNTTSGFGGQNTTSGFGGQNTTSGFGGQNNPGGFGNQNGTDASFDESILPQSTYLDLCQRWVKILIHSNSMFCSDVFPWSPFANVPFPLECYETLFFANVFLERIKFSTLLFHNNKMRCDVTDSRYAQHLQKDVKPPINVQIFFNFKVNAYKDLPIELAFKYIESRKNDIDYISYLAENMNENIPREFKSLVMYSSFRYGHISSGISAVLSQDVDINFRPENEKSLVCNFKSLDRFGCFPFLLNHGYIPTVDDFNAFLSFNNQEMTISHIDHLIGLFIENGITPTSENLTQLLKFKDIKGDVGVNIIKKMVSSGAELCLEQVIPVYNELESIKSPSYGYNGSNDEKQLYLQVITYLIENMEEQQKGWDKLLSLLLRSNLELSTIVLDLLVKNGFRFPSDSLTNSKNTGIFSFTQFKNEIFPVLMRNVEKPKLNLILSYSSLFFNEKKDVLLNVLSQHEIIGLNEKVNMNNLNALQPRGKRDYNLFSIYSALSSYLGKHLTLLDIAVIINDCDIVQGLIENGAKFDLYETNTMSLSRSYEMTELLTRYYIKDY